MNKKNIFIGLGTLAVVALLVYLMYFVFPNIGNNKDKTSTSADSTQMAISDELSRAYSQIGDLEDSLRMCKGALNLCMGVTTVTKTVTTTSTTKRREAKTTTTGKTAKATERTITPVPEKVNVPGDSPGLTENTGLCGDEYEGVFNGENGITINENSQLVYFISNKELNEGEGKISGTGLTAPILDWAKSGQEFYWDASKNLWIYESSTQITIDQLLKMKSIEWCAYIGMNSQWNYEMYVPHEIQKTSSTSVMTAIANGEIVKHKDDIGWSYKSKPQFRKKQ